MEKFTYKEKLSSAKMNQLVDSINGLQEVLSAASKTLSAIEAEVGKIKDIISVEDKDGNGIPDGEDRLNRLESETEGMTEQEVSDVWNDVFRKNN